MCSSAVVGGEYGGGWMGEVGRGGTMVEGKVDEDNFEKKI